jgi:hypothetical protein
MRYKRKSKAGPDFGCHVGDDLRPVLRNVKHAAIMYGYVSFRRDPGPLMTTPACFALQSWLRQRSIHPTTVMLRRLNFADCHASICVHGPVESLISDYLAARAGLEEAMRY